jgi:hypothetical protein
VVTALLEKVRGQFKGGTTSPDANTTEVESIDLRDEYQRLSFKPMRGRRLTIETEDGYHYWLTITDFVATYGRDIRGISVMTDSPEASSLLLRRAPFNVVMDSHLRVGSQMRINGEYFAPIIRIAVH